MPANLTHEAVRDLQPPSDDIRIWRYLDLAKLLALLQLRSLHFARIDTLDDPYEATLPVRNALQNEATIMELATYPDSKQIPDQLRALFQHSTHLSRQTLYVNCWHAGSRESAALWRMYGSDKGSVAIQSTYGRLANVLSEDTYLGLVRYLDFHSPDRGLAMGNLLHRPMCKRKEFAHEKEVRAFVWCLEDHAGKTSTELTADRPLGKKLGVDLDVLIESIRLQPTMPDWMATSIKELTGRYGLTAKVVQSQLDAPPYL